jgi:hypothetical protein
MPTVISVIMPCYNANWRQLPGTVLNNAAGFRFYARVFEPVLDDRTGSIAADTIMPRLPCRLIPQ